MTDKNPKSFRGPRAWALLAALTLTTVAAAWASRGAPSPLLPVEPPPRPVGWVAVWRSLLALPSLAAAAVENRRQAAGGRSASNAAR